MVLRRIVVVGDRREKVKEVAEKFSSRVGSDVEVVTGIGRKDATALEALKCRNVVPVMSVVIVIDRTDIDEQVVWQCWTHRWDGTAITWAMY